ncbi:MAG: CHAT domain-containing protein, partial [Cyanobacteria bacterium J06636_16]
YERLGQYDQASGSYQDALTIFETIGSVAGEADALSSLGNVAEQQSQYADALSLYEQALAIHQASGSVEGESAVLIDIGFVQRWLGNFAAAETALQQSLQVQRQIGARANEGVTLTGLALVRDEQGTTPEALDLLQEALALHQELGDRPNEAATLSDMGQLLAEQSQPELAIALLKQSVNLYESIRGDLRSLDTDLQASYTDSIADTYRTLADLLLSQNRILEAQRVLDLLKIQELDDYFQDVQRSAETASGVDFWQVETDLLALYQQVVDQAAELQVLEDKSPESLTDSEKQRLAELQAARDQAEGWFYDFLDDPTVITAVDQIRTNSRGQNLEPENFPDLANNLRLLPQKTAAFYPLILEDRLELVLVLPEGPPLRYPVAVSSQDLNQAIVNFGQALKTPSSDIQPLAQELYSWLIAPMSAQLEQAGIEALIYAPDGALRYIPLAALHDGEQYLTQRFNISHITAASLTDLNVQPQPQERQLLAAACADCEFTINVGATQFDFPDLPFTEVEVKTLAEQLAGVDILLNQEFNSDALQNLSSYDVVHLATHAAFVTGSPDESFIVFGSGETISLRDIKREWTLDNAELVVLSACETAVGSTDLGSGIEILGLGYRIEQAGAQATLASLWQVSDGGTQKLMQAFYAAMQQGMSKSAALQAAQQAMITSDFSAVGGDRGLAVVTNDDRDRSAPTGNTLTHPYYWAPFILIGNGL